MYHTRTCHGQKKVLPNIDYTGYDMKQESARRGKNAIDKTKGNLMKKHEVCIAAVFTCFFRFVVFNLNFSSIGVIISAFRSSRDTLILSWARRFWSASSLCCSSACPVLDAKMHSPSVKPNSCKRQELILAASSLLADLRQSLAQLRRARFRRNAPRL